MAFRFYTNTVSQASRGLAVFVFIIALMLIGMGVLIIKFPEIFAFLAAMIFFLAGFGCAGLALKLFFAFRKIHHDTQTEYRRNVTIHERDDFDKA